MVVFRCTCWLRYILDIDQSKVRSSGSLEQCTYIDLVSHVETNAIGSHVERHRRDNVTIVLVVSSSLG